MTISRISALQFAEIFNQQAPVVIDLRTGIEVATEKLSNCIHIPVQELDHQVLESALSSIGENENIYLLCQSGMRADIAIDKLKADSERSLVVIEGGLNALKPLDITIEKSETKVISLERQVRIAAGALTLTGVVLGSLVHPYWYGLSGFVGAGLMFAGITDTCGMGMMLARMPWNKR